MSETQKSNPEEPGAEATTKAKPDEDSCDDSVSSEEDDDLGLEGVLIRNPDASSSSSDDDSDEDGEDDDDSDEEEVKMKPAAKATATTTKDGKKREAESTKNSNKKKKKRKKKDPANKGGPEVINVEFTFHDFTERYFHGVKALLHGCSTVYQPHSSALTDLMIENISVGTVCSTEGDVDGNVFGFGSVLNVTTYGEKPCIQYLKKICLDHCPADRKKEMETVLSGKTARPAGFFFHARMVNMPLEIVEVLQNQLVQDLDWAVQNAEGGEAERKSLDFGALVRLAPCCQDGAAIIYRFFDDEIFASHAEFVYNINAPPSYGSEEKQMVSIIVMTKTGHRAAMKELKQFVGTGN